MRHILLIILVITFFHCGASSSKNESNEQHIECEDFNISFRQDIRFEAAKLSYREGNYQDTINTYESIYKESIQLDERASIVYSLINLAMVYTKLEKWDLAEKKLLEAEKRNQFEIDNKVRPNQMFQAIIYETYGILRKAQKKYDQSILFINKALVYYHTCHQPLRIANCYTHLAAAFFHKKQYEKSLKYFYNSAKIFKKYKLMEKLSYNLFYIAKIYFIQQNYSEAKKFFLSALNIDKITKKPLNIAEDLFYLAEIYYIEKNYSKATHYYKRSKQVLKSLDNEKKDQERIEELLKKISKKLKLIK